MDEAAEDEARSEQQLFALCPSPVDMRCLTPLASLCLRLSRVRGREKKGDEEQQRKRKAAKYSIQEKKARRLVSDW